MPPSTMLFRYRQHIVHPDVTSTRCAPTSTRVQSGLRVDLPVAAHWRPLASHFQPMTTIQPQRLPFLCTALTALACHFLRSRGIAVGACVQSLLRQIRIDVFGTSPMGVDLSQNVACFPTTQSQYAVLHTGPVTTTASTIAVPRQQHAAPFHSTLQRARTSPP